MIEECLFKIIIIFIIVNKHKIDYIWFKKIRKTQTLNYVKKNIILLCNECV